MSDELNHDMVRKKKNLIVKESHVRVYEEIQRFANERGFYPTAMDIAVSLNINRSKIYRVIADLCDMGCLEKQYGVARTFAMKKSPRVLILEPLTQPETE